MSSNSMNIGSSRVRLALVIAGAVLTVLSAQSVARTSTASATLSMFMPSQAKEGASLAAYEEEVR